jgi:translocation and assembly module TamB
MIKGLLAALALLLAALGIAAAWLLGSESGLHWAAARIEAAAPGRLALSGLRGALAGDIAFEEIRFHDGPTDIRLRSGELRLELLAFLGGRAGIRSLRAESLEVILGEDQGGPPAPPVLPLGVRIDSADIARIRFGELTLEQFELRDTVLRAPGAISASASFAIREARYPASVRVRLGGTLERIEATLSGSLAEVPFSAKTLLTPFAQRQLEALDAQAGPADLSRLDPQWPRTELTLQASGKASATSALEGTLAARNAQPGTLDEGRIPVAAAEARFATDFTALQLRDMKISGPAGMLAGSGRLDLDSVELDVRVSGLNLRAIRSTLRETRLDGPLRVTATAKAQSVRGTLAQAGMSLSADAVRAGDVVEIRSLRAAAEGGEATGSGRLRLSEPMRFETQLKLARFDPARFGDYPQGSINGSVEASGALGADFVADARWVIEDSRLRGEAFASRGAAHVSRNRIARASAQATLGRARLTVRGDFGRPADQLALALEAPGIEQFIDGVSGRLRASGTLTGSWSRPQASLEARASELRLPNKMAVKSVSAKAAGSLERHDGEIHLQAEGVELTARLRGSWRRATGWTGELYALRNTGRYPLQLVAPAPLSVAPGRVELGELHARIGAGVLRVKALAWSGSRLASSGEFQGLPAEWLILAGGLADRLGATALLDGRWDLAAAPRLGGTLHVRRASGDVRLLEGDLALGLDKAALDARFDEGRASITAALASRYGTADLDARLEGFAADSPVSFNARIRFAEMRVLTQALLENARLDGRLAAEVRGSGTLSNVSLSGKLEGDAVALQVPPYGIFLADGELRATLEGDRLRITRFSIRGGEGRLTASGTLPLRTGGSGAKLEWRAENFGLLQRPDLRLIVSGAGEAQLADKKVALSGALRAERGYVELEQDRLPQLGDDVVIAGRSRAPQKERARVPVALDVQLDLGEQLEVRGYGLEGKLAGRLQIETTKDGELRAYGRIHAVNATFLAYGQRLEVDPGVAIFDGPLDNPSLQMTAWRRNQQVEAGVQLSGSARVPRVQLVSQPPVPEGERLSWLVLGRSPSDATKADLGLLQAAAGALLARGDQMPLDRRIARAFGLDEISLRGSGEVGDRVVAVGKRLSDRLYISYEQGLSVVASTLVKLDLALTQRLAVRAETGTSSGVGLFYRFSWD